MFLFHIFLLVFMIIATQFALQVIFQRYGIKDSFQLRFLYFLLMALYFLIMFNYEGKQGLSVKIPTLWEGKQLVLAGIISLSGLFIFLLILWFDYSMYNQDSNYVLNPNTQPGLSSYSGLLQWMKILLLAVISGIVEELIFRYYIIDRISLLTPHLDWAVGLSSFLYGLTFYFRAGWMSVCFRGIIGFLLAVLYILTQNIIFVIFIHIIWDVIILSMSSQQIRYLLQRFRQD